MVAGMRLDTVRVTPADGAERRGVQVLPLPDGPEVVGPRGRDGLRIARVSAGNAIRGGVVR
ncbi:hypothetical protein RKD05_002049 [Microbacterium sp. SLBN-111]